MSIDAVNANLYSVFRAAMLQEPAKLALTVDGTPSLSFGDLDAWSARLAHAMVELGLSAGDRVAIQVHKSPLAIALHLACLRAGLIQIALNTAYTPAELQYFIADSGARLLVCDPEAGKQLNGAIACELQTLDADGGGSLVDHASQLPPQFSDAAVTGETVANIIYTSGTTGRPKGVMLTHRNLGFGAACISNYWGFTRNDVLLHPLPIFHAHGLFVACHSALLHGCTAHLVGKFDPQRIAELLPHSTVMMAVPTMYARLVGHPALTREIAAGVRLFTSGSAPLSESVFAAFEQLTGHRILERYGASETLMCTSNPLVGERKVGMVGLPLPGVEVRVADDADRPLPAGEVGGVQIRGENVFAGYWGKPELNMTEFTADGYFRQGDLGRFDADGYLAIVGRTKDLVISGGYNVYPVEVETVIDTIDSVSDVAVFGVPHPDLGEAVVAAIVAGREVADEAILAHARKRLASFKLPKAIVRLDELPRNTMGKVLKSELRNAYGRLFQASKA
jgi:malonyl-CoA/methylmalonyl-CoA synthetase